MSLLSKNYSFISNVYMEKAEKRIIQIGEFIVM